MSAPGERGDDALPRVLPPGQRLSPELKVHHYGRVPRLRPDTWRLAVTGATRGGDDLALTLEELDGLPRVHVVGDLHCANGWTRIDNSWDGVSARTLMTLAPPADDVTHVLAYAEYGYSATLRLEDLASPRTLLATDLDGQPLTPEHGAPLRLVVPHLYGWKGPKWLRGIEYLREPRRGFWEERGYHLVGDPWREERYSHQE